MYHWQALPLQRETGMSVFEETKTKLKGILFCNVLSNWFWSGASFSIWLWLSCYHKLVWQFWLFVSTFYRDKCNAIVTHFYTPRVFFFFLTITQIALLKWVSPYPVSLTHLVGTLHYIYRGWNLNLDHLTYIFLKFEFISTKLSNKKNKN
jgi:hypothetical protein